MTESYRPVFFDMSSPQEKAELVRFHAENTNIEIHDTYDSQVIEYIKCSNPSLSYDESSMENAMKEYLDGKASEDSGCWVYYPWSKKMVHLLDEKEFIKVRTNRNLYKIKPEEQRLLSTKKVGLIGLSVGHAVALTLALERSFGELRIADFDKLDLSNLNRIRSTVYNIGVSKTVIVAREIAELDPYLKVSCFEEGINEDNIDEFMVDIHLLIDECDSLDIKILSREKARSKGIPVVMQTSDRGMLDIERFDKDPELPILHGLVEGLSSEDLKGLTNEKKIPYVMAILDGDNISPRLKDSMQEIGQSISTWPQLGSDVLHGGASAALAVRAILIDDDLKSGRFYLDPQESLRPVI